MPFEDIRDLSDHLKFLGYPNTMLLDLLYSNYGSVNSYIVVSDILQWLKAHLENFPSTPDNPNSAQEAQRDRILLLRSAIGFYVTKSTMKFNSQKLYVSTESPNQELEKIMSLLMKGTATEHHYDRDRADPETSEDELIIFNLDDDDDGGNGINASQACSDPNSSGAQMYQLLVQECRRKLQQSKSKGQAAGAQRSDSKKSDAEKLECYKQQRPAFPGLFCQLEIELEQLIQMYFPHIPCPGKKPILASLDPIEPNLRFSEIKEDNPEKQNNAGNKSGSSSNPKKELAEDSDNLTTETSKGRRNSGGSNKSKGRNGSKKNAIKSSQSELKVIKEENGSAPVAPNKSKSAKNRNQRKN